MMMISGDQVEMVSDIETFLHLEQLRTTRGKFHLNMCFKGVTVPFDAVPKSWAQWVEMIQESRAKAALITVEEHRNLIQSRLSLFAIIMSYTKLRSGILVSTQPQCGDSEIGNILHLIMECRSTTFHRCQCTDCREQRELENGDRDIHPISVGDLEGRKEFYASHPDVMARDILEVKTIFFDTLVALQFWKIIDDVGDDGFCFVNEEIQRNHKERCMNVPLCPAVPETVDLKRCGRCHLVSYCSRKCQKMHWKKHKTTCMMPGLLTFEASAHDMDRLMEELIAAHSVPGGLNALSMELRTRQY